MPPNRVCSNCQKLLAQDGPMELCPECLMLAGFPTERQTDAGRKLHFSAPTIAILAPQFPQLEILEFIGQGGTGAVYKARQKHLDRIVALKILQPDIGQNPAFAERFTREAKALAKLNHPGIVTIHDFGRVAGLYFFLMEFVDGFNLRQLLETSRVSTREALAIVPQICDALQFAHDRGFVHHDIKPENILLDRFGRVKVADFGLAKIISAAGEAANPGKSEASAATTRRATAKSGGSLKPMFLGQIQAPAEADHRADIYALGVVFYQMLTGELPGKDLQLPSKKVQLDVRLDEIVSRALEETPELRYQQASVFKTQVEAVLSQLGEPGIQRLGSEFKKGSELKGKVSQTRDQRADLRGWSPANHAWLLIPLFGLVFFGFSTETWFHRQHQKIASNFWATTAGAATTRSPHITSFSPAVGRVGALVNISGVNFDPVATNHVVYFGAVRAVVLGASATNLVVTVPVGATYAPVSETEHGLTATASGFFLPTFLGAGGLNSNSFAPQVTLTLNADDNPHRLIIADMDGDGKPDLVVGTLVDGAVWIYRNLATNGTLTAASFAPPVILSSGHGNSTEYGLAVADLDGDGRLDIVTANVRANGDFNTLSIFQNEGQPGVLTTNSFAARVDLPVAGQPTAVAIGDLDGDGRPEIVVADFSLPTVSVLQNQSSPGLLTSNSFAAAVDFEVGPNPYCVALADLDGDGRLDVVTANELNTARRVSVLRNISTPGRLSTNSLAAEVDFGGEGAGNALAIGDPDGDGRLDLMTGSYIGKALSVYHNLSTPGTLDASSFGPEILIGVSNRFHNLALGDLGGEGKPAVAVVTEKESQLRLYRNLSTPGDLTNTSLGPPIVLPCGWCSITVAVGDLDGDGRPDLVVVNKFDGTLSLYHNETPWQPGGRQTAADSKVSTNSSAVGALRNPVPVGR